MATNLPLRHQVHDGMEAEELLNNALARHGVFTVPLVSASPVDEETGIRLGDYAVEFLRTHLNVG